MSTQPLALDYALKFYEMYSKDYKVQAGELEKLFEAYAAQQNAELVAKLYGLRKELSETDCRLLKAEAENEKLKAQLKEQH